VDALRAKGLNVYYDIGPAFDEYRKIYNQSKVAISWSSLLDTPMRVYEAMGMKIPLVANRTYDLVNQFKDGLDFKGFDTLDQAVEAVLWFLQNPVDANRIARNGYLTATFEYTWRERVGEMIDQLMRRI
jgi:spore maturation protein CgeB